MVRPGRRKSEDRAGRNIFAEGSSGQGDSDTGFAAEAARAQSRTASMPLLSQSDVGRQLVENYASETGIDHRRSSATLDLDTVVRAAAINAGGQRHDDVTCLYRKPEEESPRSAADCGAGNPQLCAYDEFAFQPLVDSIIRDQAGNEPRLRTLAHNAANKWLFSPHKPSASQMSYEWGQDERKSILRPENSFPSSHNLDAYGGFETTELLHKSASSMWLESTSSEKSSTPRNHDLAPRTSVESVKQEMDDSDCSDCTSTTVVVKDKGAKYPILRSEDMSNYNQFLSNFEVPNAKATTEECTTSVSATSLESDVLREIYERNRSATSELCEENFGEGNYNAQILGQIKIRKNTNISGNLTLQQRTERMTNFVIQKLQDKGPGMTDIANKNIKYETIPNKNKKPITTENVYKCGKNSIDSCVSPQKENHLVTTERKHVRLHSDTSEKSDEYINYTNKNFLNTTEYNFYDCNNHGSKKMQHCIFLSSSESGINITQNYNLKHYFPTDTLKPATSRSDTTISYGSKIDRMSDRLTGEAKNVSRLEAEKPLTEDNSLCNYEYTNLERSLASNIKKYEIQSYLTSSSSETSISSMESLVLQEAATRIDPSTEELNCSKPVPKKPELHKKENFTITQKDSKDIKIRHSKHKNDLSTFGRKHIITIAADDSDSSIDSAILKKAAYLGTDNKASNCTLKNSEFGSEDKHENPNLYLANKTQHKTRKNLLQEVQEIKSTRSRLPRKKKLSHQDQAKCEALSDSSCVCDRKLGNKLEQTADSSEIDGSDDLSTMYGLYSSLELGRNKSDCLIQIKRGHSLRVPKTDVLIYSNHNVNQNKTERHRHEGVDHKSKVSSTRKVEISDEAIDSPKEKLPRKKQKGKNSKQRGLNITENKKTGHNARQKVKDSVIKIKAAHSPSISKSDVLLPPNKNMLLDIHGPQTYYNEGDKKSTSGSSSTSESSIDSDILKAAAGHLSPDQEIIIGDEKINKQCNPKHLQDKTQDSIMCKESAVQQSPVERKTPETKKVDKKYSVTNNVEKTEPTLRPQVATKTKTTEIEIKKKTNFQLRKSISHTSILNQTEAMSGPQFTTQSPQKILQSNLVRKEMANIAYKQRPKSISGNSLDSEILKNAAIWTMDEPETFDAGANPSLHHSAENLNDIKRRHSDYTLERMSGKSSRVCVPLVPVYHVQSVEPQNKPVFHAYSYMAENDIYKTGLSSKEITEWLDRTKIFHVNDTLKSNVEHPKFAVEHLVSDTEFQNAVNIIYRKIIGQGPIAPDFARRLSEAVKQMASSPTPKRPSSRTSLLDKENLHIMNDSRAQGDESFSVHEEKMRLTMQANSQPAPGPAATGTNNLQQLQAKGGLKKSWNKEHKAALLLICATIAVAAALYTTWFK
ncbi:uncharacterized protein LOC134530306 [Bacillus rossius redtenbacheri]|uniref:uncharacterized protein LOC134530306 n=1 Tax=Bacillus rossius redtenbacheri TaxID=93214 RepID=UPI002FDE1B53